MARYEHLPIYRSAFDLAVHIEKIVNHFSRYHKYSLGTELRKNSREIVMQVIRANDASDRATVLLALRHDIENLKIMSRLCHESGGFANTRSYLHIAEWIVNLAKQNEGWLRQTLSKGDNTGPSRRRRDKATGETGHGQNRES